MLSELVRDHREEILATYRARAANQTVPRPRPGVLEHGIVVFLYELEHRLGRESRPPASSTAAHGEDLWHSGLTLAQVVHHYGDACQAITEVAIERDAPITTAEFRALNDCLNHVTADAVTTYARRHELEAVTEVTDHANQHLGSIAQELHATLTSAIASFDVLRTGSVGVQGSTGNALEHSLIGLRDRLDRSLTEVRLTAGLARPETILVASLLEDLEGSAILGARVRKLRLTVTPIDRSVAVKSDRQILSSILSNLLQNAFDYTRPHSHVRLHTHATADRVLFEVEDQCGGIAADRGDLLAPYTVPGHPRTGRGLEVCVRGTTLLQGQLRVCNRNHGCMFTIDLPRIQG